MKPLNRKGNFGKKNVTKLRRSNVAPTRRQLRKEQRKSKKVEKHAFLLKRLGKPLPPPQPKPKRRQKKKKYRKTEREIESPENTRTFQEDEEGLKAEIEESRKKRLLEDNKDEDRNIRSLHKKLKLSKKAQVPASFRVDGLDYLLDFCNDLDKKNPSTSKKSKDTNKNSKNESEDNEEDIYDESDSENSIDGSDVSLNAEDENEEICDENFEDEGNQASADEANSDIDTDEQENNSDFGSDGAGESGFSNRDTKEKESKVTKLSKPKTKEDEYWEDIYGRTRDKAGNVVKDVTINAMPTTENTGKYVPPMKRGNQSRRDKIMRNLKGLINRLSENNMHSIAAQVEKLYMENSRNEMNESLLELFEAVLVGVSLSSERIVLEHVLLLAILHANVGAEVGAYFIQNLVQKFHKFYQQGLTGTEKILENLLLLISYIYHFKVVDCCLIYDILNLLALSFNSKDIELILIILRSIGFRLRKDDPTSLKALIITLQQKATEAKAEASSMRVKFMLEILLAIRNNNMNKIPNYDPSFGEHLLKIIKTFIHKGNYVTELKISMKDLLDAEGRGKWWIVGSAWKESGPESGSKNQPETSEILGDSTAIKINKKLLLRAKKMGMNTDIRRNIFCILMGAEDYLDAFEKLVHLGLKNQMEREIIHVLIYCCIHELKFNPYYAFLASKFCQLDRRFLLTIQYTLWDRLKEFKELQPHHISNIIELLIHLINDRSLPITVLKAIDFADMNSGRLLFLKKILAGILLQKDKENLEEIFVKPALSEKLHLFRESLKLFMNHFMANENNVTLSEDEPDSDTRIFRDPNTLELLKSRIQLAERAMSLGRSKVQL